VPVIKIALSKEAFEFLDEIAIKDATDPSTWARAQLRDWAVNSYKNLMSWKSTKKVGTLSMPDLKVTSLEEKLEEKPSEGENLLVIHVGELLSKTIREVADFEGSFQRHIRSGLQHSSTLDVIKFILNRAIANRMGDIRAELINAEEKEEKKA